MHVMLLGVFCSKSQPGNWEFIFTEQTLTKHHLILNKSFILNLFLQYSPGNQLKYLNGEPSDHVHPESLFMALPPVQKCVAPVAIIRAVKVCCKYQYTLDGKNNLK